VLACDIRFCPPSNETAQASAPLYAVARRAAAMQELPVQQASDRLGEGRDHEVDLALCKSL